MARCGILQADRVLVHKALQEILLLRGDALLRSYRATCGDEVVEGVYRIERRAGEMCVSAGVRICEEAGTGRIAVSSEEMEEIWNLVPHGTTIEIRA